MHVLPQKKMGIEGTRLAQVAPSTPISPVPSGKGTVPGLVVRG
jgi:hypothetical protein